MKRSLNILLGMVVLSGAVAGTASAGPVLPDFTVDQSAVSNCAVLDPLTSNADFNCQFTADKMTGNYNEVLTITGANSFATEAYWDLGQFVANDGTSPVTTAYLGAVPTPPISATDGYKIYALFSSAGTFSTSGGVTTFTGTSGSVSLYVDYNVDSAPKTLPATAPGAINVSNSGDDALLATASLVSGAGSNKPGSANGDFALTFNPFSLTALGSQFFVSPNPFYLQAVLKGQFNSAPTSGTAQINGSADAYFAPVPEPATLTLLGLGLVGSAAAAKRRRKQQQAAN